MSSIATLKGQPIMSLDIANHEQKTNPNNSPQSPVGPVSSMLVAPSVSVRDHYPYLLLASAWQI